MKGNEKPSYAASDDTKTKTKIAAPSPAQRSPQIRCVDLGTRHGGLLQCLSLAKSCYYCRIHVESRSSVPWNFKKDLTHDHTVGREHGVPIRGCEDELRGGVGVFETVRTQGTDKVGSPVPPAA